MKRKRLRITNRFWTQVFREETLLRNLIRKYPTLAETELLQYHDELKRAFLDCKRHGGKPGKGKG